MALAHESFHAAALGVVAGKGRGKAAFNGFGGEVSPAEAGHGRLLAFLCSWDQPRLARSLATLVLLRIAECTAAVAAAKAHSARGEAGAAVVDAFLVCQSILRHQRAEGRTQATFALARGCQSGGDGAAGHDKNAEKKEGVDARAGGWVDRARTGGIRGLLGNALSGEAHGPSQESAAMLIVSCVVKTAACSDMFAREVLFAGGAGEEGGKVEEVSSFLAKARDTVEQAEAAGKRNACIGCSSADLEEAELCLAQVLTRLT